ncbi:MAG TPA: DinB family protein [Vicinamibacterales bacterium]|nr:DinB family protein [Vicinamibacterales bacterium]
MNNVREYYSQRIKAERPVFVKVMKAVPPDQGDYKPHPRSTSSGDLLWLLATEIHDACTLIDHGEVSYVYKPSPGVSESVAAYEKHSAELETRLASLDDAKWESNARFMMDGKPLWETTLGDMLFGFLFDAIHHRGQLSSYLRPMGAKVPSIYGPSADDPGVSGSES